MMRFKFIFPLIFLTALLPMIGCAASISVSAGLQIEPVTSFTAVELWHGMTPKTVHLGAVVVDYRMLDSETKITRDGWTECGLVMIGHGDIGDIPVAFRVWTKMPCDLWLKKASESETEHSVQLNFSVSPKVTLLIQVLRESVVTVQGIKIGRIGNMYE